MPRVDNVLLMSNQAAMPMPTGQELKEYTLFQKIQAHLFPPIISQRFHRGTPRALHCLLLLPQFLKFAFQAYEILAPRIIQGRHQGLQLSPVALSLLRSSTAAVGTQHL